MSHPPHMEPLPYNLRSCGVIFPPLIIPCQKHWLVAFHSRHSVPHDPPADCLSQAIHTTRSHHCSEFVCVAFDPKIPTYFEFGLCLLFGSERGPGALRPHSIQWTIQDEESAIYPGVGDTFSHSQAVTPSSTPQDSGPTPPAHLLLDPKVGNDLQTRRANATLMILARNSDLNGVIQSIEQVESKFNRKFNYPWVLLNEVEFSSEFKRWVDGGLHLVMY